MDISPPDIPIPPALWEKMARDLTNIAKDMRQGENVRLMTLRSGSWSHRIAVRPGKVEDDAGMPVVTSEVLKRVREDMYQPFAVIMLRYAADRTVTKSPGKKAFSEIVFTPQVDRGFELARALTKWVEDWIPIHQLCLRAGNGDALAGARQAERAKDMFVRTPVVLDLRRFGFAGSDPVLARLMLSPIVWKPLVVDAELTPDRVYSLHRTMPEGSISAETLRQIEEEILVSATLAWEKGGHRFSAFDAVIGRNPGCAANRSGLIHALFEAASSAGIKCMPATFRSPAEYAVLRTSLGRERAFWDEIASQKSSTG